MIKKKGMWKCHIIFEAIVVIAHNFPIRKEQSSRQTEGMYVDPDPLVEAENIMNGQIFSDMAFNLF